MIRIALFSGPRNLSTALMRSFEARGDCTVVDEPLYAAYLARTGREHPGRDEILASQPTELSAALRALESPQPTALQYEKHMAQHLPDQADLAWLDGVRVGLLIRDPARVVASYARVRERPDPEELGFLQQLRLLDRCQPVVIDSADLLADPAGMLSRLCEALGIPFTERMLSWEAGPRATDGVWAPHWYARVERSVGFAMPRTAPTEVPEHLQSLVSALMPAWRQLKAAALPPHPAPDARETVE